MYKHLKYSFLILSFLILSCNKQKDNCPELSELRNQVREDSIKYSDLQYEYKQLEISFIPLLDSAKLWKKDNDSLKTQLFLSNYKVEKVRFYINIVDRDGSQEKFLRGWVKRAIKY